MDRLQLAAFEGGVKGDRWDDFSQPLDLYETPPTFRGPRWPPGNQSAAVVGAVLFSARWLLESGLTYTYTGAAVKSPIGETTWPCVVCRRKEVRAASRTN